MTNEKWFTAICENLVINKLMMADTLRDAPR